MDDKEYKVEYQKLIFDFGKWFVVCVVVVVAFFLRDLPGHDYQIQMAQKKYEHEKRMAEKRHEHERIKTYLAVAGSKPSIQRLSAIKLIGAISENQNVVTWADVESQNLEKELSTARQKIQRLEEKIEAKNKEILKANDKLRKQELQIEKQQIIKEKNKVESRNWGWADDIYYEIDESIMVQPQKDPFREQLVKNAFEDYVKSVGEYRGFDDFIKWTKNDDRYKGVFGPQ